MKTSHMNIKLTGFAVFSLFTLMIVPVHADVTSVSLVKSFYTNDESIAFKGIESTGSQSVFVIIRDPSGAFQGMVSDPVSDPDGIFSTIPRAVDVFFKSKGIYDATAFTDEQKESEGITLQIEYDGDKVFLVPDFILALKSISDKTIEEEKTLSFTVSLVEITDDVIFSLEKNPPSGATINSDTGKFTWTPTKSQAPGSYTFDIVVKKGGLEDRESIKVTVTEKPEPVTQKPKPEPVVTKDPEPKTTEPKEVEIPATFVDTKLDPQYYVDRYNNEPKYKEWFDDNYSEYSSIYQAVGLEEPKEESKPKKIIGECGKGTILVNGVCTPEKANTEGGGCLIATAVYGSEMAPQVQFLREIRDSKVMSTESGALFMTGFNQFYYSFSPYVADYERENPVFKEMVRLGITPMLSTLSIISMADSEEKIVGYGIGVILMNLGMYVGAPAVLIYKARKRVRF